MKYLSRFLMGGASLLALALFFTPKANAACGVLNSPSAHPSAWYPQMGRPHLQLAADDDDDDAAVIVGMWHVKFIAQSSNGTPIPDTPIDNALVVWHNDRTEIMNSMRPPQDGNFCLGVWQRTGKGEYLLNHFAWFSNLFPNNTNNGIGVPVGPTHFVEHVTVSPDRQHYTGTFTLDAYDTAGNVVQSFTGVISADRITTETSMGDLL